MSDEVTSLPLVVGLGDENSCVADLLTPRDPCGVVVFAHGTGSSRRSVRNRAVAHHLCGRGVGALLLDLLTPSEARSQAEVFDVDKLALRLIAATRQLRDRDECAGLPIGYFGASTGAAAALVAAAGLGTRIAAVVSRGGRPDLAVDDLSAVRSPTLLIVGGDDTTVVSLNRIALDALVCEKSMRIVPGATHLFEEPGALEAVATLASDWFLAHFVAA